MKFTFYVITVIVWSEAWMGTKAHTQTHKQMKVKPENSTLDMSVMIFRNVKLKMTLEWLLSCEVTQKTCFVVYNLMR